jgi:hypothetical protein
MSQAKTRPGNFRTDCRELADGRKRLTRFYTLQTGSELKDSLIQAWGTVDSAPATGPTAGFAGLRLVDQFLTGDGAPTPGGRVWVEVYEELPATDEQLVGRATKIKLEDGRDAWEYNYLQFTAGTYAPGTVGTSTAPDNAGLFLQREEAVDDGCLRRIKRIYVESGVLDQTDQESNNGALLLRTIVEAKTEPSTPAGYTRISAVRRSVNGYPVYTYVFAKGNGQIEYDPSSDNNGKLLRLRIRHLTAPGASNPIATPAGYTLVSGPTYAEADGHRIWTASFAQGDGEISRTTARSQNGTTEDGSVGVTRLDIDYLTSPAASEPAWSGVTGYTKILVRPVDRDGHRLWSALFAKGAGLVAQLIGRGPATGLRRVTNISLGTKVSPDGIVEQDDYREADGYRIYTVTTVQTAAGGSDPTSGSHSVERYVPFTYPGRAKAYSAVVGSYTFLDLFQSPPVTAKVKATITISYVTDNTLGSITDLWNPTEWATLEAQWVGLGGEPANLVKSLPGYRSVSETPVTETAGAFSPSDLSCLGNTVFGSNSATITVYGGPEDPGGNTYTLDAWIEEEPVFTSVDGTKYYRKTVITATIPSQPALPV